MENILWLAAAVAGSVITWLVCKLYFERLRQTELAAAQTELRELSTQKLVIESKLTAAEEALQKLTQKSDAAQLDLQVANNKNASLEAELRYKTRELMEQGRALEDIGKRFEKEFAALAQKVLDEKTKTFGAQQETNLKLLLEPFKTEIINFKKEFTEKHSLEAAERNTLKGAIMEMVSNNKLLSEQANNLTKALTFQSKHQGDWGEEILESILNHCGLQQDVHYFKQYSSKNDDGTRIQPDFIINCPDERCVIVDSKVSLSHFTSYCSTENAKDQELFARSMMLSIKSHIDGLSGKKYTDIPNTLDAIIMFMPVEGAYIMAMQLDRELWRYAYDKGIILISPSNLITTIKLISNLWQRDAINKNARQIAEKAGRMYDKLVGFVSNMEKVGENISRASDAWNEAYGQLSKGRGNLITQAEGIKALGAKASKKFPENLITDALLSDALSSPEDVDEVKED